MRRRRLLWQLYLSYLLITILSVSAVAWYGSRSFKRFYLERSATELETRAHLVGEYIARRPALQDPPALDAFCKDVGAKTDTRITVVLPSGVVIADSDENPAVMDNHGDRPEIRAALAGRMGSSSRYSYTLGKDMTYFALPIRQRDAITSVVRTSVPATRMEQVLRAIYARMAAVGIAVACVAAIVTLVMSRRISRPLEDMRTGAARFAAGDLTYRLPVSTVGEMASVAEAMNEMASHLDDRIRSALRQRNEQAAILSSMVEALLAGDPGEHLININAAAARLLGIDIASARGRAVQEIVRNTELQQFIKHTLASSDPVEGDIVLHNGDERFLQARGTTLRDSSGSSLGAVVVLSDVTGLKQLEHIRRDFVANVSHELRTPITSIKGFVETLTDGASHDPKDAERFLAIIAKQADRLNAIVEDLLSLARIEEDAEKEKIQRVRSKILDVLRDAVLGCEPKASEKKISIDLDCSDALMADVDPQLIEQAVVNLIDNAVKYSEAGGRVSIGVVSAGDGVTISVRDNGCGIEEKHLPRLFERFYRVDRARSRELGGTGLGLAIVKHIAQAHGGRVTVLSAPGKGSTFSIHLPNR
jgi:two-component system phosphate regulon sensor histidine kinase PhoR